MMNHLFKFLKMIAMGTLAYAALKYPLLLVANWFITNYNYYATNPAVTVIMAVINWGLLFFCWLPAIRYLWVNTQRPEAVY